MIPFRDQLLGAAAETVVRTLLQSVAYTVIPTGMEHSLASVVSLSQGAFARMQLPPITRAMPDLLVSWPSGPARHLEVKFRSRIHRGTIQLLRETLTEQQLVAPDAWTAIVRAWSPAGHRARLEDLVAVLPPRSLHLLSQAEIGMPAHPSRSEERARVEEFWRQLTRLDSAFPRVLQSPEAVENTTRLILALGTM